MVAYTRDVLGSLVAQGTPADIVQIGNEINPGLLWDYSATWTGCSSADDGAGGTRTVCHTENWDHVADLLTAASNAVKSVSPTTKVMLHLANGGDNGTFRWWFDNVTQRGVPYDVIGVSHYVYWHGDFAALQYNLDDVVGRYGKDVIVVETAYPFTTADKDGWEKHRPERGHAARDRIRRHAGRPGRDVPRRPLRRPGGAERARSGCVLVGCDLDRRARERLDAARPDAGKRVGEPGALRLRRPRASRRGRAPTVKEAPSSAWPP